MSDELKRDAGAGFAAPCGSAASLCRDCWYCECAVPIGEVIQRGHYKTIVSLPSPAECPYCGAANPLGEPPNDKVSEPPHP